MRAKIVATKGPAMRRVENKTETRTWLSRVSSTGRALWPDGARE